MATAESDKLLADMWASFIAGGAPMKCSAHNEEHGKKSTSQTWEDLPHLKRDGSAELQQMLPSLGRWMSMGEEDWEQQQAFQGSKEASMGKVCSGDKGFIKERSSCLAGHVHHS
eukprot:TRINITY_DN6828_c0_g1_i3.p2 TRINITY_DN6828_c0_g1~~TRINITY_DN6828_c0_g1_i3.p2  ORF type:complete len:114 (-),score=29.23 TRINITY_DN6828_c0_g1_i3:1108-1449(-)